MVHVDISGFGFDIARQHLLYGCVFLFLAMLVLGLHLREGRNEALGTLVSVMAGLGLLGGLPVFPDALSTFLRLVAAVVGLLAIAHEVQRHGRTVITASIYVLLWASLAYGVTFGPFWLVANPWLLQD